MKPGLGWPSEVAPFPRGLRLRTLAQVIDHLGSSGQSGSIDAEGRMLFCSPAEPASCTDITHVHQLGLVKNPVDGPAVEILADAGYQGPEPRQAGVS